MEEQGNLLKGLDGQLFQAPSDLNRHALAKKMLLMNNVNDAVDTFHRIKYLNKKSMHEH